MDWTLIGVTFIGAIFTAIGIYTAIRSDLKVLHANYGNLKEETKDLERKVDRHVENLSMHYGRRDTDTTGSYPRAQ
jgi:hypothetical protein